MEVWYRKLRSGSSCTNVALEAHRQGIPRLCDHQSPSFSVPVPMLSLIEVMLLWGIDSSLWECCPLENIDGPTRLLVLAYMKAAHSAHRSVVWPAHFSLWKKAWVSSSCVVSGVCFARKSPSFLR